MRFKVEAIKGHVHSSKGMLEQVLNQYDADDYELLEMYSVATSTPEYFNMILIFEKILVFEPRDTELPNFYEEPQFDSNGKLIREKP